MTHRTDEQFEEILAGTPDATGHLDACSDCRAKLQEKLALRDRLKAAFGSVHPGGDFLQRLRAEVSAATLAGAVAARAADSAETPATAEQRNALRARRVIWRLGMSVAMAAAIVLAVTVAWPLVNPKPVLAAETQLAQIHLANLQNLQTMPPENVDQVAAVLSGQSGQHAPRCNMKNCTCQSMLCGKKAVSYLVDDNGVPVSIVVAPLRAETLGFGQRMCRCGRTLYCCSHKDCRMVSVQVGDRTYVAIGKLDHQKLTTLLMKLLAQVKS